MIALPRARVMWVFAAAASAAAASPAPMQIDVLPGQAQQFEITATNDGDSTQQFEARAYWRQNAFVANVDIGREYTFSSLDSRCATLNVTPISQQFGLRVDFGPLHAGQSRRCGFSVYRHPDSTKSLGLSACVSDVRYFSTCEPYDLNFGTMVPTRITVGRPVQPAAPDGSYVLDLTVHNLSLQSLPARVVTTDCQEFEGSLFSTPPFHLDTSIPGGCALSDGELCLNVTGQNYRSYGFLTASTSPGASSSCHVRVVPNSATTWSTHFSAALYFLNDYADSGNGNLVFAPSQTQARIRLGMDTRPVPVSPSAALVMAMLMMVASAFTSTRRAPRQR
ncbi:hypothetical protein [Ahniella affigens]|nr:hypothetical protein [Ahniella affigens]